MKNTNTKHQTIAEKKVESLSNPYPKYPTSVGAGLSIILTVAIVIGLIATGL